jgi:hypothetical protein
MKFGKIRLLAPSTTKLVPETYEAIGEAKKSAALAISFTYPNLLIGPTTTSLIVPAVLAYVEPF